MQVLLYFNNMFEQYNQFLINIRQFFTLKKQRAKYICVLLKQFSN